MTTALERPLAEALDLTRPQVTKLTKLGLLTIDDLLHHRPRRYEDRRQFAGFPNTETEEPVCLVGLVQSTATRRLRGRRWMFEVEVGELTADHAFSQPIVCRWFNAHYVRNMIRAGQRIVIYGRIKPSGKKLTMSHPEFEVISAAQADGEESSGEEKWSFDRITPVYPAGEGITQRFLREALATTLESLSEADVPSLLPASPRSGANETDSLSRLRAFWNLHFPDSLEDARQGRDYLASTELFLLQMIIGRRKFLMAEAPGKSHVPEGQAPSLLERFHQHLPFSLTGAQLRAIREIRDDMALERPMNRLLQGDVGSGKTLVALSAMLLAVEAGYQAALMAPTQILAEQHYLTACRMFERLNLRISLRTGNRREEEFLPLFQGAEKEPQIVIGTHALFYDQAGQFENLGLIVIDEQHKFGVVQRSRLIERGDLPDVLVMTATPIPRTLTMTLYGDLDVSVLDEKPRFRGTIVTRLRGADAMPKITDFIRQQIEAGRQAYIVYPLIDDSENMDLKAATTEFNAWKERLAPAACELIHGRMKPEDKEAVMTRFRDGQAQVLVATTVIEVGVDVPNATVMLIENAERFGLAQLHQLRGRIGRGTEKSYCILLSDTDKEDSQEKLKVLEKTSDGFEIAEADQRLRGPGDILGTAQSGLPHLRIANLVTDLRLFEGARTVARKIIACDPDLNLPEHAYLRSELEKIRGESWLEVS